MSATENEPAINELKLNINGTVITFTTDKINKILGSQGKLTDEMNNLFSSVNLAKKTEIKIDSYKLTGPVNREVTQLEHDKLTNFQVDKITDENILEILGMKEDAETETSAAAATTIQAMFRGSRVREKAGQKRADENNAATKIQAVFRGSREREKAKRLAEQAKNAKRQADEKVKQAEAAVNDAKAKMMTAMTQGAEQAAQAAAKTAHETAKGFLKVSNDAQNAAISFFKIAQGTLSNINSYGNNQDAATAVDTAEKARGNWEKAKALIENEKGKGLRSIMDQAIRVNNERAQIEQNWKDNEERRKNTNERMQRRADAITQAKLETRKKKRLQSNPNIISETDTSEAPKIVMVDNPLTEGKPLSENADESSSSNSDSVREQQQEMGAQTLPIAAQALRLREEREQMLPKTPEERAQRLKDIQAKGPDARRRVQEMAGQAVSGAKGVGDRKKTKKKGGGGNKKQTRKK